MKIALVGEAPFDTESIMNLLKKKWNEGYTYFPLLHRIRGSELDTSRTKNMLRKEYEIQKPQIVIFIRDLDGLYTDKKQLAIRKAYFTENNRVVNKTGFFLLNIYEIEALLLTDLEMLNKHFNTELKLDNLPIEIPEPKEFIRKICSGYSELNNPELFEKITFEKVLNHPSFNKFIHQLSKVLP